MAEKNANTKPIDIKNRIKNKLISIDRTVSKINDRAAEHTNNKNTSLALFEIENATPGSMVTMGVSFAGAGPLTSPYGQIDLSKPIRFLPAMPVASDGRVLNFVMVPGNLSGVSFWTQALVEEPSGPVLTDSHALVIQ